MAEFYNDGLNLLRHGGTGQHKSGGQAGYESA